MNNKRIILIICSLVCLTAEIIIYYICSKGYYDMACIDYVYYYFGIITLFFIVVLIMTTGSQKAVVRFNLLYAISIVITVVTLIYYLFVFYKIKWNVGNIIIGILTALYMFVVLMTIYYGISKKYVADEAYMLQLFTFVGVGGLICLIMAQHHVFNTVDTVYISKISVFSAYVYIVILVSVIAKRLTK